MKSSGTFCCVFQYQTVGKGNKYGGHEYDDLHNSPFLQNARPRAVAPASYSGIKEITNDTVGLHAKTFEIIIPNFMQVIILK